MDKQELIDTMAELKLTQREASELLGVNVRTVRKWKAGESKISFASAIALRCLRVIKRLGYDYEIIYRRATNLSDFSPIS